MPHDRAVARATRNECDPKPRTMQFLVERICEHSRKQLSTDKIQEIEAMLPFAVWVKLIPRKPPPDDCGGAGYIVEFEQLRAVRAKFGMGTSREYSVCEHMGRLIE